VFVIIDENESESTTFGPGSEAPYLSQTLVSQGAYLSHYYGIGHASLDNYVAMVSGQAPNPQTSGDCPTFAKLRFAVARPDRTGDRPRLRLPGERADVDESARRGGTDMARA
jgi:phosphatidylinositol-3-phosphatase